MTQTFEALGLREDLVRAVTELGFEHATPIQEGAIPALLAGQDVLGQAQTGTGKTAAFALPMLQRLDLRLHGVQGLVLTPTRELALQVAEAIDQYGKYAGVRVAPIYGGSSYARQIRKLKDGAQIVVGTPGRITDLMESGRLSLANASYVVLDEADRMLDMGFVDAVEAILGETPEGRQTTLFSATFPREVMRLADRYMNEPVNVKIERKTLTVEQTEQCYYLVYEEDKRSAVMRLLEVEDAKSALIFTRTKIGASSLAETLIARGYAVEAIHGDLTQEARETVIRRFRQGLVTTLVATDVMARGLDIESVSHVINYDVPYDPEDYVHRIGRTGRAGREGVAITFITPRERRMLKSIEQYTKQAVKRATLPSRDQVLSGRDARFVVRMQTVLEAEELDRDRAVVNQLIESGYDAAEIAAAAMHLARMVETLRPLEDVRDLSDMQDRPREFDRGGDRGGRFGRDRGDRGGRFDRDSRDDRGPRRERTGQETGMVRLMMDAGRADGVSPGDVVGAVASEAGIPGKSIGAIDIHPRATYFDVKEEFVEKILRDASRLMLRGQGVRVSMATGEPTRGGRDEGRRPFDRDRGGYRGHDSRPPRRRDDRERDR
jgi:ATP-dependent RNA helicase DeaD